MTKKNSHVLRYFSFLLVLFCSFNAKAEYQIPADDPIFTHRVDKKELQYTEIEGENGKLEKILLKDYIALQPEGKFPGHVVSEMAAYNKWHTEMAGKLWYEAINEAVEKGWLNIPKMGDEMCQELNSAWGTETDLYRIHNRVKMNNGFDEFALRAEKHAELIGAKLAQNPVVGRGQIEYRFYSRQKDNPSGALLPDLSHLANHKERKKREDKIKKELKESFQSNGFGCSGWVKNTCKYKREFEDDAEGNSIYKVSFDVSKDGFFNFYSRPDLQTPPKFIYEHYQIGVYWNMLLHSDPIRMKYGEQKRQEFIEEQRKIRHYELDFFEAKPKALFSVHYRIPYDFTDKPRFTELRLFYGSQFENEGDGFIKVGKQSTRITCFRRKRGEFGDIGQKIQKPYFDLYSIEQIKSCEPYRKWFNCYVRNYGDSYSACHKVSAEKPEMCKETL